MDRQGASVVFLDRHGAPVVFLDRHGAPVVLSTQARDKPLVELCRFYLLACQVRTLFLCLRDVFRVLSISLVCGFCTGALGLVLFQVTVVERQLTSEQGELAGKVCALIGSYW